MMVSGAVSRGQISSSIELHGGDMTGLKWRNGDIEGI